MNKNDKIYIAGHNGMVGSAITRKLIADGFSNLLLRSSTEIDLRDQAAVATFFEKEKPVYVFLAAARVGGIMANNTYRADFIYDNIIIEANVIHSAYINNVKKLMFLGSSCIYPKLAPQPLKEEYLLSGKLEYTNQPYAIAKIAGIEMCDAYRAQYDCNFISVMPTNLYGPNDNYDAEKSHVLPALLRRFILAEQENKPYVEIWGTGKPRREFLYADDLAEACFYLMEKYNEPGVINIGFGEDVSIIELALIIKKVTGYKGEIRTDASKPDGTPQKLLDVAKLAKLGWQAKVTLEAGIRRIYNEARQKIQTADENNTVVRAA